jgi:hypothetical protein
MVLSTEKHVFLVEYIFWEGNRYTDLVQEQCAEEFLQTLVPYRNPAYRDRPHTLNKLKTAITTFLRKISQADLQKVFANKIKRVQACIDGCGHNFQNLCKHTTTFRMHCIIIIWDHHHTCDSSLTETSLRSAYLYFTGCNFFIYMGHMVTYRRLVSWTHSWGERYRQDFSQWHEERIPRGKNLWNILTTFQEWPISRSKLRDV